MNGHHVSNGDSVPAMVLVPMIPLLVVWVVVGVRLTVVDLREHRLPNALTIPMLVVVPFGLGVADLLGDAPARGGWIGAGLGAAIWFGVLGLLWLVTRGKGMGLGDVKLAPSLGATLGWLGVGTAFAGLIVAFVLGVVVSLLLLVTKRVQRRTAIPFGPFLLLGSAVTMGLSVYA
jgi:leader peptidase (prepilin peptidase)/N-methyltransferase